MYLPFNFEIYLFPRNLLRNLSIIGHPNLLIFNVFQFFTLTLQGTYLWDEGDSSYEGPDTVHGYLPKLWSLFTLNAFIHVKEQKLDGMKFIFDRKYNEIILELEIKNIWKFNNVLIYHLVISAERMVNKNFLKYLQNIS